MKLTGNTILITGGGSGIGRGLAEALHKRGNKIIVAGRRLAALDDVVKANPGMASIQLDIADPDGIASVARNVIANYPGLNVLINCAGIQTADDVGGKVDDDILMATVATNLLGPIRLTSALMDHLKKQPAATIAHVTSMLGYLPHAAVALYSATKAAMHSYTLSQRYRLKGSTVEVLEISPPYVQTDLLNGKNDPRAMPLAAYIDETMQMLATGAEDVFVESARVRRDALRPGEQQAMNAFNDRMTGI